jgi:Dolichyl-phosphate-mannose-protein mannosyltransferase
MSDLRLRFAGWAKMDKRVLAPLIVAALLRLGLMIAAFALTGTQVMTQGDTASYLGPGQSLMAHGVYASAGLPEIDRTPGYPLFLELMGMWGGNVLLAVVAQIAVALLSLLLVRRITDRIFPDSYAGVIAAWLFAIEPLSIVSTVRLMPETLFVLLLLVVIDRILLYQETGRLGTLATAGVFLAAATYVRPVSYYLGFALAAGLAITAGWRSSLWWKAPAVLLLSVLPLLTIWQARNWIETGYSGFSSIVEKNLYFFQSAEVSAELQHISLGAEQKELGYLDEAAYVAIHPEQRDWSQSQRLHYMRAASMKILSQHPGLYLKTHVVGVGVVMFTPCGTELLQLLGAYPPGDAMPHRVLNEGVAASVRRVILAHPGVAATMALLEGFLLLLYLLALRGCLNAGHLSLAMLTLAGVAAYFLLISGGAQAVGRYRSPVMPELCILAAGGVTVYRKKKSGAMIAPRIEFTT